MEEYCFIFVAVYFTAIKKLKNLLWNKTNNELQTENKNKM